MIYQLDDRKPVLKGDNFVADNAAVIGSVVLEKGASVWWNVTIRGDNDVITLGENVNIQDGSVMHTDGGVPLVLERNVSIGHLVMLSRHDALAEHDLDPGIFREQFVGNAEHAASFAEQVDAMLERCRNLHFAARAPEILTALVQVVMQDDEIADVLDLGARLRVVLRHVAGVDARRRWSQPPREPARFVDRSHQ